MNSKEPGFEDKLKNFQIQFQNMHHHYCALQYVFLVFSGFQSYLIS